MIIHNEAGQPLKIAFAATATATAYTILLAQNVEYQGPLNDYTGAVSGIWQNAGSGNARITEITT